MIKTGRKLAFGLAHSVAHVGQRLRLVPAELELQNHVGIAFRRRRRHGVEPVQIGQLGFHRLDQQRLAVFGRNAREGE